MLDGGIDLSHTDLNVVGGVDCVSKKGNFDDLNGHGTHVAGTIAAKDDGVDANPFVPNLEVVGVVPGARLWAVRVLTKNGAGTLARVICAGAVDRGVRDAVVSEQVVVAAKAPQGVRSQPAP